MDFLFPYDIVEENGFYGMKDCKGNFVVPCIMDMIHNLEDEELGLSLWADYGCVYLYKDDKIGFFTNSGKYIAPEYDEGMASPDRDIYVRKGDQYAVFYSPDYEYRAIEGEDSILTEYELYDDLSIEEECERYIIRTDYTLGETIILKGCGPDMKSSMMGQVIYIDDEHVIVKVECIDRLLSIDLNRYCLTEENVEKITGKKAADLRTYEHDRFLDALDPETLYPCNVFNIPGFDPMEFA
jgi:hypothetical protein